MNSYTQRSIGADFKENRSKKREVIDFFFELESNTASEMGLVTSERICLHKTKKMLELLPPIEQQEYISAFYEEVLSNNLSGNDIFNFTKKLNTKLCDLGIVVDIEDKIVRSYETEDLLTERQIEIAAYVESVGNNANLIYLMSISFILLVS